MAISDKTRKLLEAKKKKMAVEKANADPTLPGKNRVEGLIEERPDRLSEFAETFDPFAVEKFLPVPTDPISMIPGVGPMSNVVKDLMGFAGGLSQRIEGGIANVADVLQTGDVTRSIPEEFIKGVKGERFGELGDPIRRLGKEDSIVNEVSAAFVGLGNMAALTNVATKGKLVDGAKKMEQAAVKAHRIKKVKAQRKQVGQFKKLADQFRKGLDDAFSSMRQEYEKLFAKIGKNPIEGDDLIDMTDIAVRHVKGNPTATNNLRKLAELTDDIRISAKTGVVVKNNTNSAHLLRKEIGRSIPKDVWNKTRTPTPQEAKMVQDYWKLNEIIAKNANGTGQGITKAMIKGGSDPRSVYLRLNAKMSRLYDMNGKIRPILQTSKGTTKSTIRLTTKSNAAKGNRQGEFDDMMRFSKEYFKQGKEILKEVDKANKSLKMREALKKKAIQAGLLGLGALEVERLIGASRKQPVVIGE